MAVNVFEPYTNPVSGETFQCLSADESAYIMRWAVQPGGYVPFEHIHLQQDEIFHIHQGSLRVLIEGEEQVAQAGETLVVPQGKRHIAFNQGDGVLDCTVEFRPGLDYLKVAQCVAGLLQDGDYDKHGAINIPKMGYFLKHMNCQSMTRPTSIPAPVFGLALFVFHMTGVFRGWKKIYRRYTE